jgi:hypothetical protein
VSSRAFHHLDQHAWWRVVGWLRAKYKGKTRLGWKELRRRFCDQGWRFAHEGTVFIRRLQRQSDPLPLPRQHHQNPVDTDTGGRHQRLTNRPRHVESPVR